MMNEPKCCPWCGKPIEGMKVETNIFDKEETFTNCTVQVLTNTVTGETSVGWWENAEGENK